MNFFRQQADALIQKHFAQEQQKEETRQDELLQVKDPKMDAAIEQMKEHLDNLRAQTTLQRMKNQREEDKLRAQLEKSLHHVKDSVATLAQRAQLRPYMEATKQVSDYAQPGVVASLQAQLCLNIHALCMHQEQLRLLKEDSSEVIFWFEDCVKQLRRDQADQEMQLMNDLVQTRIEMGELVDAKKIRERTSSNRSLVRGPSRRLSNNQPKRASIKRGSLKTANMQSQRNIQNVEDMEIQEKANRRRTVRKLSRRGTALPQKVSSRRGSVQGIAIPKLDIECHSRSVSPAADRSGKDAGKSASGLPVPTCLQRGQPRESPTTRKPNDNDESHEELRRPRGGRPIRRGVERARSRSLTDMSRRRQLSKQPADEINVSRRNFSDKQLLVGFPRRKKSQDDSTLSTKRRGSTHQLLRDFASPSAKAPVITGSRNSEGLASTLKNWMGSVTVRLHQPAEHELTPRQPADHGLTNAHKIALVG